MSTIKVVGIDIAKSVFQVCVWMADGSVAWNRKISRQKLLHAMRQFPPQTLIAMEACSTSHFWGRTLISMGYNVKLIPTQHVKAFARHQKNDANDALAICETACRPGIHFVSVKTTEQQDIKALRSARQLIVEQRTALANQLRALLAEYGVIIPAGLQRLQQQRPEVLEDGDNTITFTLRRLLSLLREDMQMLTERIDVLDKELAELSSQQVAYHHLLTVGPLIAAAVVSEVDATQFSSGSELSAWCGLVPRQHSSSGKQRLSSMTKNGNRNLRTLIIHGARAVMRCVQKRDDRLGRWVKAIELRSGFLKATPMPYRLLKLAEGHYKKTIYFNRQFTVNYTNLCMNLKKHRRFNFI